MGHFFGLTHGSMGRAVQWVMGQPPVTHAQLWSHVCNCEISSGFWTSNIKPLLQNLIGISFNFDFNLIMFYEAVHGEMRAILTYVLIKARCAIWEFRYNLKLNNLNPIHPFQNFKTTVRKHYYRMFICPMDNFRKQFNVIELVYKNL